MDWKLIKLMRRSPNPSPATLPVTINVTKLSQIAVFPAKRHPDNPYYGLSIVQREDERPEDTAYRTENFMTNLAFDVPEGHYLEITANKNLHIQGYLLAQGSIIVGPSDNTELIIPLYKYAELPDLDLPSDVLQFTLQKTVPSNCALMKGGASSSSSREAPGFNSNNSFYQPPDGGRGQRRQDASMQRSQSSYMPDFGDGPSTPSSSSRSSRPSSSSHLF